MYYEHKMTYYDYRQYNPLLVECLDDQLFLAAHGMITFQTVLYNIFIIKSHIHTVEIIIKCIFNLTFIYINNRWLWIIILKVHNLKIIIIFIHHSYLYCKIIFLSHYFLNNNFNFYMCAHRHYLYFTIFESPASHQ